MNKQSFLLFDIDGVIRDVANSYRLAIKETVKKYCGFKPSNENIDDLKAEGCWNNDWDTSLELIKRYIKNDDLDINIPPRKQIVDSFNTFYFGGDPNGNSNQWKGFIKNEPLLVNKQFFEKLNHLDIAWGFVSGAESSSAKYVLEQRIGLNKPPLIAMEDAPSKPDPTGLIKLATQLSKYSLGELMSPIGYVGDTVADVKTVIEARSRIPKQKFISFALAPPHLHLDSKKHKRWEYENELRKAGADVILSSTEEVISYF